MRLHAIGLIYRDLISKYCPRISKMQSRQQHVTFNVSDAPSAPVRDATVASLPRGSPTPSPAPSSISRRVSVGIVIIGDEILKGQVADTNSHYLCQRLTAVGAEVKKISVVPDEKDLIATEIKSMSPKVRWLITAGGVGPTHDDVTYEGIGTAFELPLEPNETLVKLIRHHFRKPNEVELAFAEQKLASVPRSSKVFLGDIRENGGTPSESDTVTIGSTSYPVVSVRNVLIMPGIPVLLKRAFNSVKHLFESENGPLVSRLLYMKLDELSFAENLTTVAEAHKPRVLIGSYPDFSNNYYKVKLVFESIDSDALKRAVDEFISTVPADSYILESDLPGDIVAEAEDRIYNFSHPSDKLRDKVAHALQATENAIRQYGAEGIGICFTGGKDCTVVLHILYAALQRLNREKPTRLLALQLSTFEPYPEVEQFIGETKRRYGFHFESYIGSGMKESLGKFVHDYPNVKAVFMGTRRNDPSSSKLNIMQKTDPGWPELMRVSPILDWSYSDVWTFIRHLHLPYCSLYDRGYTSLGNPSTTHPNRLLLSRSSNSLLRYRPAYELEDESAERSGRDAPQALNLPNSSKL